MEWSGPVSFSSDDEEIDSSPRRPLLRHRKSPRLGGLDPAKIDSEEGLRPTGVNGFGIAVLQFVNSTMGSGILHIPYVFSRVGMVWGSVVVVAFAVVNCVAGVGLVSAGEHVGVTDYSVLTERVFGRYVRFGVDMMICLSLTGVLLSFLHVIGHLGSQLCAALSLPFLSSYAGFLLPVSALILLPMCLVTDLGSLAPAAVGSVITMLAMVAFVGFQGPIEAAKSGEAGPTSDHSAVWGDSSISIFDVFACFGSVIYALTFQDSVFELYFGIVEEQRHRWPAVVVLSSALSAALLIVMGVLGSLAFGADVETNILANFEIHSWSSRILMGAVLVHLLLYVPSDFVVLRHFLFRLCNRNVMEATRSVYVVTTVGALGAVAGAVVLIPGRSKSQAFALTLSLTGDIPAAFISYVMPGLLFLFAGAGVGAAMVGSGHGQEGAVRRRDEATRSAYKSNGAVQSAMVGACMWGVVALGIITVIGAPLVTVLLRKQV